MISLATRGTSNRNERGSAKSRRARRTWLVNTFRANGDIGNHGKLLEHGQGFLACRCYRCGTLLTVHTVTVDRIVPGCQGGTYARNNIRPACGRCNSETGGGIRSKT